MQLAFVTGNDLKFTNAQSICGPLGIELVQQQLDIVEIQSDQAEDIAKHKVAEAFNQLKAPVVVTDDTWFFRGLNNWPGPYMKYMNDWLTPDDFLRLTAPVKNREIVLRQVVAYQDDKVQKLFSVDIAGSLMPEVRGESKYPHFTIISFDGGQHSAAEANGNGYSAITHLHNAWHDLADWLKTKPAAK